jgi:hypothetical protein
MRSTNYLHNQDVVCSIIPTKGTTTLHKQKVPENMPYTPPPHVEAKPWPNPMMQKQNMKNATHMECETDEARRVEAHMKTNILAHGERQESN